MMVRKIPRRRKIKFLKDIPVPLLMEDECNYSNPLQSERLRGRNPEKC
jgi:hypothetical protein